MDTDETGQFLTKSNDSTTRTHTDKPPNYGSVSNNTSIQQVDNPDYADHLQYSTDTLVNTDLRTAGQLDDSADVVILQPGSKKQSSIITIFSIWNTMMGTSTLCISWAIHKAGFGCSIILLVLMAGVTLYTACLIIKCYRELGLPSSMDFTDVCRHHLGRLGACISFILSILSLTSAGIVFWVLMSNFLYYSVDFVYELSNHEFKNVSDSKYNDVVCYPASNTSAYPQHLLSSIATHFNNHFHNNNNLYNNNLNSNNTSDSTYHYIWNLHLTAPLLLILLLLPLISLKSPTFFTKFTACGSISIAYLIFFVTYKSFKWGIHLTFQLPSLPSFSSNFLWTFPTLSGILSLAYFIHNAILVILSHQKHPENNIRDLSIAYTLVMITFCYVGLLFYASFPLPKFCIADNLLNNFVNSDFSAFLCRIFLLLQMTTTFPLLIFILKSQILKAVFNSAYPGTLHVMVLNVVIVTVCVLFAVFYPQVGNIIRYFGSICGLGLIFTLPPLVRMLQLKERRQLNAVTILFYLLLMVLGTANFIAQFFI